MDDHVASLFQAQQEVVNSLYEAFKPRIWSIKKTGFQKSEPMETYCTGFTVYKDEIKRKGYLMSCAHDEFHKWASLKVELRPLNGETGVTYEGLVVDVQLKWDLCLIEIPIEALGKTDACTFGPGCLDVGQVVMAIGNNSLCRATAVIGTLVYPCCSVSGFAPTGRRCEIYEFDSLSSLPSYKTSGHVFNVDFFAEILSGGTHEDKSEITWMKNLQSDIPIVHCTGLACSGGCSGCPMFTLQGELIGMFVYELDGYQVGIHVSVLETFLNKFLKTESMDEANKADVAATSSTSKRRKTK